MNEEFTKVITAGVSHLQEDFDYSMTELKSLCEANNMEVVDTIKQNLDQVVGATYFGKGKVEELEHLATDSDVQVIVINDELSPSQIRNLEEQTGLTIIDRTELILQVFASRAQTKQSKLQVEIAQLQYELPRIHPSGNPLDQQKGGSGTNRGAGETKLELDRRVIRNRITYLKKQLQEIDQNLETQNKKRKENSIPTVALVGYTNSGKSTTMNALLNKSVSSNEDNKVFEKDMLFATLDTSVRNITLADNTKFLLSDTVGFVNKLPHNLVESFKSTLAEASDADLIIQVIDFSDPNFDKTIAVTDQTLKEVGVVDKPKIIAYNKADLKDISYPQIEGGDLYYSAMDEKSIDTLIDLIKEHIFKDQKIGKFLIPYTDGNIVSYINENLDIISQMYKDDGTEFELRLSPLEYKKLAVYLV
ncbi:GTPase HflX [Companilactobacillus sp. RD055328]|uniref:GTPase HflX n=1 Tax=Companilactobacillus sp. RD055328 TaxID=2916634 RepID=UPI001FC82D95|nr:GTPase HflX [Companilactobacillus sp. RD055328]GKQ42438.1 GTPase HflX [Companilactobacillus sp. RD055328]